MRARLTLLLLLCLAMLFTGCSYGSLAGVRFTYTVIYSVTTTLATPVDISYREEVWRPDDPPPTHLTTLLGQDTSAPWSVELPAAGSLTYDYSDPFCPAIDVSTAGNLPAGETVTVSVSWKDYRTGFTEEVLAQKIVAGTGTAPLAVALYSPELPLVR